MIKNGFYEKDNNGNYKNSIGEGPEKIIERARKWVKKEFQSLSIETKHVIWLDFEEAMSIVNPIDKENLVKKVEDLIEYDIMMEGIKNKTEAWENKNKVIRDEIKDLAKHSYDIDKESFKNHCIKVSEEYGIDFDTFFREVEKEIELNRQKGIERKKEVLNDYKLSKKQVMYNSILEYVLEQVNIPNDSDLEYPELRLTRIKEEILNFLNSFCTEQEFIHEQGDKNEQK